MANQAQERFDNPSKLFIWLFSLEKFIRGRSYYNELLKELNLSGSESVLEFGSGVGSFAKTLATKLQPQGNLTCVDVSDKLLTYVKGKLKKFDNVQYFSGDIKDSKIINEKFDFIVSTWVLHHVDKALLPSTISKLRDLLKETGKMYIIEFPDSKYNHTKMTQDELLEFFRQSNLKTKIVFSKKHGILYELNK